MLQILVKKTFYSIFLLRKKTVTIFREDPVNFGSCCFGCSDIHRPFKSKSDNSRNKLNNLLNWISSWKIFKRIKYKYKYVCKHAFPLNMAYSSLVICHNYKYGLFIIIQNNWIIANLIFSYIELYMHTSGKVIVLLDIHELGTKYSVCLFVFQVGFPRMHYIK